MLDAHCVVLQGKTNWKLSRSTAGESPEDVVRLKFSTAAFQSISARDTYETIRAVLRHENVAWVQPSPEEWRLDLQGLAAVIGRPEIVPWLKGMVVIKPEFKAEILTAGSRKVWDAEFVFYITPDTVAGEPMPAKKVPFISDSQADNPTFKSVMVSSIPKHSVDVVLSSLAIVVAIVLYLLDKSGKGNLLVNVSLLILIAGFLIFPTLSISWIRASRNGSRVWRRVIAVGMILLAVTCFGIWTWPDTANLPQSEGPRENAVDSAAIQARAAKESMSRIQRPVTKLSASQIIEKINAARPYEQDDVAAAFKGTPVDWRLGFLAAKRGTTNREKVRLSFLNNGSLPVVVVDLPVEGNDYLRLVEPNEEFRVRGVISAVDRDDQQISLENGTIERLSDDTVSPSPP